MSLETSFQNFRLPRLHDLMLCNSCEVDPFKQTYGSAVSFEISALPSSPWAFAPFRRRLNLE